MTALLQQAALLTGTVVPAVILLVSALAVVEVLRDRLRAVTGRPVRHHTPRTHPPSVPEEPQ